MVLSSFLVSLISGAASGTSTDIVFFPIDTIKTRLQAKGGYFHNGGYRNIYKGIGSAIIASAPSASLFFITYDSMKDYFKPRIQQLKLMKNHEQLSETMVHMLSSSMGEVAACTVRVPAEVIKQRTQTGLTSSSYNTLIKLLKNENGEGIFRNLYRGWNTTLMREIPFTCIQFPLYEFLKKRWTLYNEENSVLKPWQGAICGSIAGGVAAAITTPLDFIKTRLMLSDKHIPTIKLIKSIWLEEGSLIFFSGIGPRTLWISAGGAIFLGMYETVKFVLTEDHLLTA
ncbi:mitochondrial RNA-splicing protein Mrs4p [Monosporozyma servazzii]